MAANKIYLLSSSLVILHVQNALPKVKIWDAIANRVRNASLKSCSESARRRIRCARKNSARNSAAAVKGRGGINLVTTNHSKYYNNMQM